MARVTDPIRQPERLAEATISVNLPTYRPAFFLGPAVFPTSRAQKRISD